MNDYHTSKDFIPKVNNIQPNIRFITSIHDIACDIVEAPKLQAFGMFENEYIIRKISQWYEYCQSDSNTSRKLKGTVST